MKLSGYTEVLKVRAVEAKSTSPTRHDWDSYFRDAKNMNEMNPGSYSFSQLWARLNIPAACGPCILATAEHALLMS